MGNYLALAALTAAFGRLITGALQAVPNLSAQPELRIGRPPADPGFVGANLCLYRTALNASRQNLPTRGPSGAAPRSPQLALDVDYLLSFYGSDVVLEPHRLMGSAIASLNAHPVLTAADIRAAIGEQAGNGVLAGADLDQQVQRVRLTMQSLDLEQMHHVWSLFGAVPHAMSVAYTASAVLLDAGSGLSLSRAPRARRNRPRD